MVKDYVMPLKKILSIALPCFIVIASVAGTSGYVYADKHKNDRKQKENSKKRFSDTRTKQHHDTRRNHPANNQQKRHEYSRQPSRRFDSRHHGTRDRYYRPPSGHTYDRTRPKIEHYYRKGKRHKRVIVIPSRRHHDQYIYIRPFRNSYPHYRPLYFDNKFWGWLAFSLVTLQILDQLNDNQRHEHEYAMHRATQTPIGKTIVWSDDKYVSGSVTPVWEGSGDSGQYCREFRHEISIDDRTEISYGTACQRRDGTWEIVH